MGERVNTGRESGRDGHGVPHDGEGDTFGQADVGQGNWIERGPTHDTGAEPRPAAEADGPLGQGRESRSGRADGAADPAVRSDPSQPGTAHGEHARVQRPVADDRGDDALASGLSNYSRTTQYGNQSRYGTPTQYNAEAESGGEAQNGGGPENNRAPGESGAAHPNG